MNSEILELFQQLELKPNANLDSVRHSYRQLVKVWHPDRFAHDQALQALATDKLKKINAAYEQLVLILTGDRESISQEQKTEGATGQKSGARQTYSLGLNHYYKKDYHKAFEHFLNSADA